MIEFAAFNHKVTEPYQYPDDGYRFVTHECGSPALGGHAPVPDEVSA